MNTSFVLKVFDFDGVLAIPWTHPECDYPQIKKDLLQLPSNTICCVASFNPRAEIAIKGWGIDSRFLAFRSGSNHVWYEQYEQVYRSDMSKSKQIQSMLNDELKHWNISRIEFYDDDALNIQQVNEAMPHVHTYLVDSEEGWCLNKYSNK